MSDPPQCICLIGNVSIGVPARRGKRGLSEVELHDTLRRSDAKPLRPDTMENVP